VLAARLCGAAQALLHAMGASLLPTDRADYVSTLASLRDALSAAELEAALAEGRALSLAAVVEEALAGEL
jgi:hypothetical protein